MSYVDPVLPLVFCLFLLSLNQWFARRCGGRKRVIIIAIACLFLWSWPPVNRLTSATLEKWYPVALHPAEDAQVIVVLSGGLLDPYPSQPQATAGQGTYLRARHAAWLHKNWRTLPVLASGGPIGRPPERQVVSDLVKDVLIGEGVPAEMVWTERESLNTHENAVYTASILLERGLSKIVLVTEGVHMLRAERCFRKQGFEVIPAPCSYQHLLPLSDWKAFMPKAQAIKTNDGVLHEWVGLVWYWMRGWI